MRKKIQKIKSEDNIQLFKNLNLKKYKKQSKEIHYLKKLDKKRSNLNIDD